MRCSNLWADSFITTDSASCSGVWQATTVTGSPAPCSDHSFLSKSFSLLAITVLAALRMRVVER